MSSPYFQTDSKAAVWVHGMVYDIETGKLVDLNISRGPGSEAEGATPAKEGGEGAPEGGAAAAEGGAVASAVKVVAMPTA